MLDLFSGIGGFSFSLESIVKTVGYCDIDPKCRDVIKNNINKRVLQDAPIFEDVTKITKIDLNAIKPTMISAGFPCTDISSANPYGKGIKGERSGLFHQILRIIDECRTINCVFLENSPRILKKGFHYVKKSMLARGFNIKYCIISARDVGALHKRQRWYCLCYKNTDSLKEIDTKLIDYPWNVKRKIPTIVRLKNPEEKKHLLTRCQMLGNSIVPQCARYAWNTLVESVKQDDKRHLVKVSPLKLAPKLNLVFSDGITTTRADYWATPCHSLWHNYTRVNERGIKVLSSQLYYSVDSHIQENSKIGAHSLYFSNPVFIEYLMGYPTNWTMT